MDREKSVLLHHCRSTIIKQNFKRSMNSRESSMIVIECLCSSFWCKDRLRSSNQHPRTARWMQEYSLTLVVKERFDLEETSNIHSLTIHGRSIVHEDSSSVDVICSIIIDRLDPLKWRQLEISICSLHRIEMLLDRFWELVERDHCVCGDIDMCPFTCGWGFQDLHIDRRATGGKTNSSCMSRIWGRICPLTELLAVSKHVFSLPFTRVKESKETWLYHDWSLLLHLSVISFSLSIAIRTKSISIEMTPMFHQSMSSLPTLLSGSSPSNLQWT